VTLEQFSHLATEYGATDVLRHYPVAVFADKDVVVTVEMKIAPDGEISGSAAVLALLAAARMTGSTL